MDQRSRSGIALACVTVFGIVATCAKEVCPRFEPFQNGKVWYRPDRIDFETIAIFKCDEGAEFFNTVSYSVCYEDGWTHYPVCKRRCEVPKIPYGRLEYLNGSIAEGEITHDIQLKIVCDDKYTLEEEKNRNIKCKDGNIEAPKCLLRQLEVIPSENMVIDIKGGLRWRRIWRRIWIPSEGRIRVACKRNYELFQNGYLDIQSRQCVNDNGVWKPPFPECKEARCDVPYISNGLLELQNGQIARGNVEHDVELKTVCDENYEIEQDKHSNIKCNRGDIERQKCVPRFCSRPTVKNAVLERNMTKFQHSFETYITCNEGYEFSDGSQQQLVKCSFGIWTHIPSQCVEKKCPVSGIQGLERLSVFNKRNNRLREHETVKSRETVYLRCKEGYKADRRQRMGLRCSKGVWFGSLGCSRRIKYRVRTTTGSILGAGTDGDVYLKIFGENGQHTNETELTEDIYHEWNKFENGDIDEFHVYLTDVGNISHIEIRLDGTFFWRRRWFLQFVSIYDSARNKYYGFPVRRWMSSRNEITKLQINGGSEQRQCGDTFTDGHILRHGVSASLHHQIQDEVACKMVCIERGLECHATMYFERIKRCYTINWDTHQSMMNLGGGEMSVRRFCNTD